MEKRNVFISVSHGFHIRNFLQTKFIHSLIDLYNVIMIINDADKGYLKEFLVRNKLDITVEGVTIKKSKLEERFVFFRKSIFVNPKRASTKNFLNEIAGKELGRWRTIINFLNSILGRFEVLRSGWRSIENLFFNGSEFDDLIRKYNPQKIITANYGTEAFEIRLLRSARRLRIQTIAIVPSWDNLTSKGVMGIKPDYLVVWNEIMAQEAEELHSFSRKKIFITGPLQFDNFFDPDYRLSKEQFHSKFKISPGRPIIVFGTITPRYFKYNIDILEILKENIDNGNIKGNPKILVRIHPQVVKDPVHGDNLDRYLSMAKDSDTFCLSIPEIESWATMHVPKETDYTELISALTYANISMASASTLIFDSFACNTCFIGIGFDGRETQVPYNKSVRRMFEFEHYKNVSKIGGFYVAESIAELVTDVNNYLDNPEIHKKEREITLNQQITYHDGKNYERVIAAIKEVN